jgi:uncharacterized membrane protein
MELTLFGIVAVIAVVAIVAIVFGIPFQSRFGKGRIDMKVGDGSRRSAR